MSNKNEILPDSQEIYRDTKGFTQIHNWIIKSLSGDDLKVYLAIMSFAFRDDVCTAKNDTISEMFGISFDKVKRSISRLKANGYISIEHEYSGSVCLLRKIYPVYKVSRPEAYIDESKIEKKNGAKADSPGAPVRPAGCTSAPDNNTLNNNNTKREGAKAPRVQHREVTVQTVNNLLKLDKDHAMVAEQDIQEAIDYWKAVGWMRLNGTKIPEKMRIKQAAASSVKNMRMRMQRAEKKTTSQYKELGSDQ